MTARFAIRLTVLAAGMGLLAGGAAADDKKDDKKKVPESVKEIMKKGHASTGLLKAIGKEVKDGKWEEAKEDADLLKLFGETLGKIDPPQGSKESWKKLTKKYEGQTADVYKAVEKKDAEKAEKSLKAIGGGCKECHTPHKPN